MIVSYRHKRTADFAAGTRMKAFTGVERAGKNFRDRDGGHGKDNFALCVTIEERLETRRESRVAFENVNDGCGIDDHQRAVRQRCSV